MFTDSSADARVTELRAELAEARVQYEAMCALLRRRQDVEEESEVEGDEREHLIVPPDETLIGREALGKPHLAVPQTLAENRFNRRLALRVASRLRRHTYSLSMFYADLRDAFPELRLYMCKPAEPGAEEPAQPATTSGITSGIGADDE